MKIDTIYEAPSVETAEIAGELGFAASTGAEASIYSAEETNYGEF